MAVLLVESVMTGDALCAVLPNKRIVSVSDRADEHKDMLENTMQIIEDSYKRDEGGEMPTNELLKAVSSHMSGQVLAVSLWERDEYSEVRNIIKEAGMRYV
jgi:hypothetical protein